MRVKVGVEDLLIILNMLGENDYLIIPNGEYLDLIHAERVEEVTTLAFLNGRWQILVEQGDES